VEPQSQVVKPGSPAILTCSVHDPDPAAAAAAAAVVQWTFNGRTLTDTLHRRGRSRGGAGGGGGGGGGGAGGEVVMRRRRVSMLRTVGSEYRLQVGIFTARFH